MAKLTPGSAIGFTEVQSDGSGKDVPAVVLWAEEGYAVIVIARGTSQTSHNSGGFDDAGVLEFFPTGPVGKRMGLTKLTRFRSNDVKRIQRTQITKHCGLLPRGDWKQLATLTQRCVEELAQQSMTPPPSVAEDAPTLRTVD